MLPRMRLGDQNIRQNSSEAVKEDLCQDHVGRVGEGEDKGEESKTEQVASPGGRFPRVFGDKFGEEFCDKFGDEFSESPNLVMNQVENFVTNLVIHQNL